MYSICRQKLHNAGHNEQLFTKSNSNILLTHRLLNQSLSSGQPSIQHSVKTLGLWPKMKRINLLNIILDYDERGELYKGQVINGTIHISTLRNYV